MIHKSSPANILRERLVLAHQAARMNLHKNKLTPAQQTYFMVKAYKAYVNDEPLGRLSLPKSHVGGEQRVNNDMYKIPRSV